MSVNISDNPILFCRIGWMEYYKGLKNDTIQGGGRYVDETGVGYEAYNFKPYRGYVYGYCRASGHIDFDEATINIIRLGAEPEDEIIDDISVVWYAKHPEGTQLIVGWYRNATVFRSIQEPPSGANRYIEIDDYNAGYYISARAKDAVLLDIDDRAFRIPRGKGWSGQSNVWFCDQGSRKQKTLLKRVAYYIGSKPIAAAPAKPLKSTRLNYTNTIKARRKVELISMQVAENYYRKRGFKVKYVDREKLGYDLLALSKENILHIEVKGLSGSRVNVELTPNEYRQMKEDRYCFRLCIVSNALNKKNRKIHIIRYSRACNKWVSQRDESVLISEKVGARVQL